MHLVCVCGSNEEQCGVCMHILSRGGVRIVPYYGTKCMCDKSCITNPISMHIFL